MATKHGTTLENVSRLQSLSDSYAFLTNHRTGSWWYLCTHRYNLRMFKNRGAVLVLVLSFCGLSVLHFLMDMKHSKKTLLSFRNQDVSPIVMVTMCLLVYPVFGWLADVCWERYKVIKWSLRITFITLMVFSLVYAFQNSFSRQQIAVTSFVSHIVATLSLGGFQANIIQFGVDQLTDASSSEIASFIRWYTWVWLFSGVIVHLSFSCVCFMYEVVAFLLLPTLTALALCLDMLCNHWLIKEKMSRNSHFTLIFKVLRYAARNKYPRLRNAFSYWDDRQYSRIDLAKTRFGGPFTTEQVEDVKTFFRIIAVIIIGTTFIGLYIAIYPIYVQILYRLNSGYNGHRDAVEKYCEYEYKSIKFCLQEFVVVYPGTLLLLVFLPVFELFLYPLFLKFCRVSILQKAMVGLVLMFLSLASCAAVEFAAHHRTFEANSNFSDTCPLDSSLQSSDRNVFLLDYKWMSIPYASNDFAQYVFMTSAAEFLCAQSPYSMRGVLFGLAYGSLGFFVIVGYLLLLPLRSLAGKMLSYRYGCIFWYTVFSLGVLICILVFVFVMFKCYKRRVRKAHSNETG